MTQVKAGMTVTWQIIPGRGPVQEGVVDTVYPLNATPFCMVHVGFHTEWTPNWKELVTVPSRMAVELSNPTLRIALTDLGEI